MMSQEYRSSLPELLVKYYERLVLEGVSEVWQRGLEVAREWQRLTSAEAPDQLAIEKRDEGSAWIEMEMVIRQWAAQYQD